MGKTPEGSYMGEPCSPAPFKGKQVFAETLGPGMPGPHMGVAGQTAFHSTAVSARA